MFFQFFRWQTSIEIYLGRNHEKPYLVYACCLFSRYRKADIFSVYLYDWVLKKIRKRCLYKWKKNYRGFSARNLFTYCSIYILFFCSVNVCSFISTAGNKQAYDTSLFENILQKSAI